jgi:hypothetical protein
MEVELYNQAKQDLGNQEAIELKVEEYDKCNYATKELIGKQYMVDAFLLRDVLKKQTNTILYMDKEIEVLEEENNKMKELISTPDLEKIQKISEIKKKEPIVVNSDNSKERLLRRMKQAGQFYGNQIKN